MAEEREVSHSQEEMPPVDGARADEIAPPSGAAEGPQLCSESPETASPATIEEALAQCGISLFPEQIRLLDQYFHLRNEWNSRMNLTRHTDYRKFVGRDVVDAMSFARVLSADEVVLDVGTGCGVPGVILAVLRPDLQIVLCESVAKRARAVADICERMNLPLPVLVGRAENFLERGGWEFHSLVIRAVSTLLELMRWFKPYWHCFDRMLLLKGPHWVQERGQARHYGVMHGFALRIVDRYTMPFSNAESVLLQVCPEERLIPPRGCQLRKLRYENLPTGLITPDRPGPLSGRSAHAKETAKGPGRASGKSPKPTSPTPSRKSRLSGKTPDKTSGDKAPRSGKTQKRSKRRQGEKGDLGPKGKSGDPPARDGAAGPDQAP